VFLSFVIVFSHLISSDFLLPYVPLVASNLGGLLVGVLLAHVRALALLGLDALVVVQEGPRGATAARGAVLGALERRQGPEGGARPRALGHTLVILEGLGAGLGWKGGRRGLV
jgi:hypothetical protein